MKEILFSYLDKYVEDSESVSVSLTSDKWYLMPYRCGDISGKMLFSGELTNPPDVRLKLGLCGYYKIFIGTINLRSKDLFNLKLSSDESFDAMTGPTMEARHTWDPCEYFEEFLWRCAELKGDELVLRKPESMWNNACALAFVRCVPVTREEYLAFNTPSGKDFVHGHMDEDPNDEDVYGNKTEVLCRYRQLTGGDINEMSLEFSFDYDTENEQNTNILRSERSWQRGDAIFSSVKESAYRERVDYLHSHGISVYAANRMSVTTFTAPYSNSFWTKRGFVDTHPEYYCRTRLGEEIKICSYAYPEVRKYVIDRFVEMMKYGYDGVTLILHRGLHIGFEEPVLLEFAKRYPEIDPHTLPVTDDRLNGVFCHFMTEFMRELRAALIPFCGGKAKINVITDYTPETSRHFGLDVASWAREGLCDRVMQGIMEVYEDLSGLLNEDGTIDLSLYREKLKKDSVIRRYHHTDLCKAVEGSKAYMKLLEGTKTAYSAALPWQHRVVYSEIESYKETLRNIGVKNFFAWNTNHTILDVAETHAIMGRGEEYYTVNRYRTLMLDGSNMSEFNPNWRG